MRPPRMAEVSVLQEQKPPDFGNKPAQNVVNYIVTNLQNLLKDNDKEYRRYFLMLELLAENRDLQQQIK